MMLTEGSCFKLPERGCPGRTYEDVMDVDTDEDACYESTPGKMWKNLQHRDHSHPRARVVGFDTRSGKYFLFFLLLE